MKTHLLFVGRSLVLALGVSLLLMAGSKLGRQENVNVAILVLIPLGLVLLDLGHRNDGKR